MTTSNYLEEKWLNTLRGVSFSVANVYAKLHTGDPGEDGTANAATETTRQLMAFNAAANPGGTMTNSGTVSWTNVAASETYAYLSFWDAVSGGNCLGASNSFTGGTVSAGNTFQISAGGVTWTLS